jgi:hypothetical protein
MQIFLRNRYQYSDSELALMAQGIAGFIWHLAMEEPVKGLDSVESSGGP